MKNTGHLPPRRWDIFCRVIDNYGDIGVCWRLARQLQSEYGLSVRLWLDDLAALRRLWPSTTDCAQQVVSGVEVIHWPAEFPPTVPAEVVIEAFACELPATYVAAMARQSVRPHWLNLEYLSAEAWVDDCHGMRSIHPQHGLAKTFFFPGFTKKTGGLLCETQLRPERDTFQTNSEDRANFLASMEVSMAPDTLLISLFSYENPAIHSLVETWRESSRPIHCLVPEGRILTSISRYFDLTPTVGAKVTQNQLTLQVIPFMTQDQYDRLLWSCDINFVRGEDSFVRGQWAAKPLVWHIYPQDEEAHLVKLAAFMERYHQGLSPILAQALEDLWYSWNHGDNCQNGWNLCMERLSEWQLHSHHWEQTLNSLGDLAAKLVQFCEKPL